ncbi:MAG TPA: PKD domain-containing protein [Methanolinea sp.]|nr:PKD domain-containing protein [Methanolinea sp.]HQK55622.1 PKD domain-containing protein [Methanolinea sp.]
MKCEKGLQIAIPMVLCLLLVLPASAALGVNGITPSSERNTGTVYIDNLSGTDFPDQGSLQVALNRTGYEEIAGQFVTVVSETRATCVFDLLDKEAGDWNVTVTNTTSGQKVISPVIFTVRNLPPVVTAIDPDDRENTAPVYIQNLSGSQFRGPAAVTLSLGSEEIDATNVTVQSATMITCDLDITGATPGDWNVTVTNYDGQSDVLEAGFRVRDPRPTVTGINPSEGSNDMIAIGITDLSGTGFMQGATVNLTRTGQPDIPTINGAIVQSPAKILCFFNLSGAVVGKWDVVVTNPDLYQQSGVLEEGFTIKYPDAPGVTGIIPSSGVNDDWIDANVTGSGFYPGASVILSQGIQTITGTDVQVVSGSDIGVRFNLTGKPNGSWDLTVINNDGQEGTKTGAFTITNPPPTVTSIDPPTGSNAGWVSIQNLSGTGFFGTPTITFSNSTHSFNADSVTRVSDSLLQGNVNLAGKAAGDYNVTVTNPDGLSSAPFSKFTIVNPDPTIVSFDPEQGETTESAKVVTVTGTNFLNGAGVNLTKSGKPTIIGEVTFGGPTSLTSVFNLTGSEAGAWNLVVTNPDGNSVQATNPFIITNPPPNPISILPTSGENSNPIAGATLHGTGFLPDSAVKLVKGTGIIQATILNVNVTTQTIMCVFNLDGAAVGPWDVVVTNTGDNLNGTLPGGFFIRYPSPPNPTGIDPASAPNNAPVSITNLSGTGFKPGATVLLNRGGTNITAANVTVSSEEKITCNFNITGATPDLWDVIVINEDGQAGTSADLFEIRYPAPTVSSVSPPKGYNNQASAALTIMGSGFRSAATVRLNSTSAPDIVATNVSVGSVSQMSCSFNLSGKAVGDYYVIVTNDDGQSNSPSSGAMFTVEYPYPSITSIEPPMGSNTNTALACSIAGNYFRPNATVKFTRSGYADILATGEQVINPNTLNFTVNLSGRAPGDWNVVVRNDDSKAMVLLAGFKVLPPAPVPDFTATPVYGTVPLTVKFTDNSLNNPIQYAWNFGDGTILVGLAGTEAQNPSHTYNEVGTYNVTLRVINEGAPDGVTLTKTNYIVVVRTPVADFNATPRSGNSPLLVQFTDLSDGNPNFWTWRFGDGSVSNTRNPYHLYTAPGVYSVSLSVRNTAGTDTVTKTDYITVRALPVAEFTANRTSGVSPLTVQFTDQSTGVPSSWAWVFGDGTTSTEQNPNHTYTSPGTYSVRLTVNNGVGTDSKTKDRYITVSEGMQAAFDYTTSNPENLAPLTVAFTDTSTGAPSQWIWNFGDGYLGMERNPIHTYTAPGNYTVTLTVSDSRNSSSVSKTIEVMQRLVADFRVDPASGSAPLRVRLIDTSIGKTVAWQWWIINHDETVLAYIPSGGKEEVYTLDRPGNYSVMLDVTDSVGQIDVKRINNCIQVLPFP